jgi:hypothetical protein
MRVVKADVGGIKTLHHLQALDQRGPAAPSVAGLMNAAAGHRNVKVRGVTRVNDD